MTPEEMKALGRQLRSLRRARGLTQDQVTEISEVSADTIRRLEHGRFSPTIRTLDKLVRGLDSDLGVLMVRFELSRSVADRHLVDAFAGKLERELSVSVDLIRRGWQ